MLHSLNYNSTHFSIIFTAHTRETRVNESIPRDALIYPQLVEKLLRTALINGLTSFRNKGQVVITTKLGTDFAMTFLVSINNNNIIVIRSILVHPFIHYYIYIKCKNRINLWNLVFPIKTVLEAKTLCIKQARLKKPKNFKKNNIPKQRLDYTIGSKAHTKAELDNYTTSYNHKRNL